MGNPGSHLLPEAGKWAEVLRVIDVGEPAAVEINANSLTQRVLCYRQHC